MNSMRDIAHFGIKYRGNLTITIPQNQQTGAGSVPMFAVLANNPQYAAFSQMFDQCRIVGIRVRMTPNFQVSSSETSRASLVYAWDRNGTIESTPSIETIVRYGSAMTRTIGPSQSNTITSSIYATDLAERTTYVATSAIAQIAQMTDNNAWSSAVPFKPVFLAGISLPVIAVAATTFSYILEVSFDLVFRGVRFTGAPANQ